jgi:LacI family transcriptional regulator
MGKSKLNITALAKVLKVSPSTVSRALNDSSKISEKTKTRVREKAKELGYELNQVASSLSKNRTGMLGVIVPEIKSYFFSRALSGIEGVAHDSGFQIIIAQTNDSYKRERDICRMLQSARVDGVVASLSLETTNTGHFELLQKNNTPVVLFDRVHYELECTKVLVDNYEGAFLATDHLIKAGCKRPVHFGGPPNCRLFHDRAEGYRDALKKHGIAIDPEMLLATDLTSKDVRDALKLWMNSLHAPDGIFTATASTGLLMIHLLKTNNISIPSEMAVISFGKEPCNEFIEPSLSSVEMPGYDMGRTAVSHLINALSGKTIGHPTIIKPISLQIRNSSFKK